MKHRAVSWGPLFLWGEEALILKPLTYMNLSGLAVVDVRSRYGVTIDNILVIYDDMALPFGTIRLRGRGSSGGHKGMQSVINSLASESVPRLRIGIGSANTSSTVDHVLSEFTANENSLLPQVIDRACEGIRFWVEQDIQKAMSNINSTSLAPENDLS
jgi:PTH1 family peptidyl-tRNA hydrolase